MRTLSLLFTLLLSSCATGVAPTQGPSLSPIDAYEQSQRNLMSIVDIRPASERAHDGSVSGASPIEFDSTSDGRDQFIRSVALSLGGDTSRPIALLCRQGVQAGAAQRLLHSAGFSAVYVISGGFLGSEADPGWKLWGLPVEPAP